MPLTAAFAACGNLRLEASDLAQHHVGAKIKNCHCSTNSGRQYNGRQRRRRVFPQTIPTASAAPPWSALAGLNIAVLCCRECRIDTEGDNLALSGGNCCLPTRMYEGTLIADEVIGG